MAALPLMKLALYLSKYNATIITNDLTNAAKVGKQLVEKVAVLFLACPILATMIRTKPNFEISNESILLHSGWVAYSCLWQESYKPL